MMLFRPRKHKYFLSIPILGNRALNFSGSIVADINISRKFLTTSSHGRTLAIINSMSVDKAWASSNIRMRESSTIELGDDSSSCPRTCLMMMPSVANRTLVAALSHFSDLSVPRRNPIYRSVSLLIPQISQVLPQTLWVAALLIWVQVTLPAVRFNTWSG